MEPMKKKKVIIISISVVAVILVLSVILIMTLNKGNRLIVVESFEGNVSVNRADKILEIIEGIHLITDDYVAVREESLLELLIDEDKHVIASSGTEFELVASGNVNKGRVNINLVKGDALISIDNKLPDDSYFEIYTPNAIMSVRGTEFETSYEEREGATYLFVSNGVVNVKAGDEERDIIAGMKVKIDDNGIDDYMPEIIRLSFMRQYNNTSVINTSDTECVSRFTIDRFTKDGSQIEEWRFDTDNLYSNQEALNYNYRIASDDIVEANHNIIFDFYDRYIQSNDDMINEYYYDLIDMAKENVANNYNVNTFNLGAILYVTEDFPDTLLFNDGEGNEYYVRVDRIKCGLYTTGGHIEPDYESYLTERDGGGIYAAGVYFHIEIDARDLDIVREIFSLDEINYEHL